ncbi:HAMP domain-containing sensor histidine kinase [Thiobacillus sp.]|uniref:sensor histidine kinase n=1 Tax=Thiobacillus sp. TaxID=924 RepID=UPI0025E543D6|nr:HAMP domain-containing sensor histidine kinase [Thiobacillus sp.]
MNRRSLAFRLTVILAVAWFALFLVLGGVIWQSTQRLILEAQADKARALATQLATISLDAVLLRDYGTLERYLADLSGAVAYAEIRRADGQVLGQTGQHLPGVELFRVPMLAAGEQVGEVLAQYDPQPAHRAAWQLAGLMALALTVFSGLTFWALRRLLLSRLVAPVAALIEQADPERTVMPMAADAPTEVADLAAAIGGLRERISRHIAEAEEAAHARNEALRRLCSEQRLAAVGQLAGEVAHELNTPLSNILGYAQSALPAAIDAEQRDALMTIEAQARRAGQIVRDMLTAARAPAPSLQVIDLETICAAFVRLVTPLARKQGAVITLEPTGPVPVRGDASRVEQILFNLVFNAVQAGASEVRLTPSIASTPELVVSDNGPGLPEMVRTRLFEPFVTTKPAGQGTGLGLAISQRLAREMGAELEWVEPARGACFRLVFPPLAEESAP